jgi:hypothetical protein
MQDLPKVCERILGLELATWDEMWRDVPPHFSPATDKLGQEEAGILDVKVVTPGRELHGQELRRGQGMDAQAACRQQALAEG